MKTKYKIFIASICFVILLGVAYKQYEEKKLYEEYVSHQINGEVQRLVIAIDHSLNIYEEIIDTGKLKKGDASTISIYSRDILSIPQELHSVGLQLQRIETGTFSTTENIAKTAQTISPFFMEMIGYDYLEMDEIDDVLFVLENDPNMRKKIEHLHELYELWSSVVKNNLNFNEEEPRTNGARKQYKDISVKNKEWAHLVIQLDEATQQFFYEKNIDSIDDLLNE